MLLHLRTTMQSDALNGFALFYVVAKFVSIFGDLNSTSSARLCSPPEEFLKQCVLARVLFSRIL